MDRIIQLLKDYSPAFAVLVAIEASIVFSLKLLLEKSLSAQFDKLARAENRKSNFREKVDRDCYELLSASQKRIVKVSTQLRRILKGYRIEGFTDGGEIVQLRDITDEIVASLHMLPPDLAEILMDEIKALHKLAEKGEAFAKSGWKKFDKHFVAFQAGMKEYLQRQIS